jgi:hypothetical protein
MKRGNQVAIQVAFYFRRNAEAGGNCDHGFLKSLGSAGAVVQFPFDVPECPRPHSFGEVMDARINGQIAIITGSNPEWWNPACVRAEHSVPCFPAHRLNVAESRTRLAVGELQSPTTHLLK